MRRVSCLRQRILRTQSSRSMRQAPSTLLPIIVALTLLPTMAFASPPDPSWIAGIYDGADGDDIVVLVCETSAANPLRFSHVAPLLRLQCTPLEITSRGLPARRLTRCPRSPPALCLPGHHGLNSFPAHAATSVIAGVRSPTRLLVTTIGRPVSSGSPTSASLSPVSASSFPRDDVDYHAYFVSRAWRVPALIAVETGSGR